MKLSKIILVITLVAYISIPFFLFQHSIQMGNSHMTPMEDCPFAFGEHSLCPMTLFAHLGAWQKFSTAIIPLINTLLLAGVVLFFLLFAHHSLPIARYLLYLKRERPKYYSLYQQLFSRGILNPKAP